MLISSILDPLRDLYRGPQYVQWNLRQVQLADIATIDLPPVGITINQRHTARALAWAPEGVLRLQEPSQHVCGRVSRVQQLTTLMWGCSLGAAMVVAPITTCVIVIVAGTLLLSMPAPAVA